MEKPTSECLRCRTLLSAAMDGEATFNEAEFVRRHLGGCPDCREAQQAYHSLRAQLRLMPTPEPPAALRLAVMNRVHGNKALNAPRRSAAGISSLPLLAPWQKGVFVTASLVLMFVAGFLVSMLLRPQPFEVEGQPVANAVEQKVVVSFNRPLDRNYILENAPSLFTVKDAQNNLLTIDYDNIVVDGNTVELPIRRDASQIQENEPIQVFVDSHIKDEKGTEVTNPGPKAAVVATQAPAVAPTRTKPGQVQAVVTTPVPPTATSTTAATAVPATTAPAPQKVDTPVATTAPPMTVTTTTAPAATITPTVTVSPTATTAPVTPTTVPATGTVTGSPTVTTTGTPTVGTTPTVPVSPTAPVSTTVAPTSTAPRPTTTASPGTRTPGTTTAPVTGTPVISATTSVGPSTSPGTITPDGTVTGSPSVSPTTAAACNPDALKGGFQKLYPAVQTRLGCPTAPQSGASFTYQVFQKGSMLYYQQTGRIYVFYNFGGWASYRATGPVAVQATNTPSAPPSSSPNGSPNASPGPTGGGTSAPANASGCSFTPRGSFGTLWRNNQAVQSSLGCPTGQDNSTSAGIGQTFSRGLMLFNPLAGLPYLVVYNDGGFQAFPNQ